MDFSRLTRPELREFLVHNSITPRKDDLIGQAQTLWNNLWDFKKITAQNLTPAVFNLYVLKLVKEKYPNITASYPLSKLLRAPRDFLDNFCHMFGFPFPPKDTRASPVFSKGNSPGLETEKTVGNRSPSLSFKEEDSQYAGPSDYELLNQRLIHLFRLLGWVVDDTFDYGSHARIWLVSGPPEKEVLELSDRATVNLVDIRSLNSSNTIQTFPLPEPTKEEKKEKEEKEEKEEKVNRPTVSLGWSEGWDAASTQEKKIRKVVWPQPGQKKIKKEKKEEKIENILAVDFREPHPEIPAGINNSLQTLEQTELLKLAQNQAASQNQTLKRGDIIRNVARQDSIYIYDGTQLISPQLPSSMSCPEFPLNYWSTSGNSGDWDNLLNEPTQWIQLDLYLSDLLKNMRSFWTLNYEHESKWIGNLPINSKNTPNMRMYINYATFCEMEFPPIQESNSLKRSVNFRIRTDQMDPLPQKFNDDLAKFLRREDRAAWVDTFIQTHRNKLDQLFCRGRIRWEGDGYFYFY